ncbi:hypothetical protein LCL61_08815 [Amycolatopsis coloradensis]|uniref:Uncharacterized protein n=1 Tax=Amycolatopsis coloradensis TaxID=76021 RepID=A0ACD5B8F0_9PSEU
MSAQGNHHGLVSPSAEAAVMLLAYYSNGAALPVEEPVGAISTRDRFAVIGPRHTPPLSGFLAV